MPDGATLGDVRAQGTAVMAKITPKQERVVLEYLCDLNATQAAIRAGYSQASARMIGPENLSKPAVAQRLSELMAERNGKVQLDGQWVLERLVAIVDRDPDGSKNVVAIKDLLRTLELIGKHSEIGAFQDKLQVDAGEDMAELILAARKRHRAAAAKRNAANGEAEEAGA